MKKQNLKLKYVLGSLFALATMGMTANAQLIETMGTTGASTETIATREANNRFDMVALTYSGTADVRNTVPSTGYPGASGGYNVLIQAQETFQAQVINAALCESADSLIFGVFKSTNASTIIDFLVVEFSIDNGLSWTNMPFAAAPTGSGTSRWYRRGVAIPTAAQTANLWIRFRSTLVGNSSSNPQFRIDDLNLACGSDVLCDSATAEITVSGPTTYCAGAGTTSLTVSTNISGPIYQWYDQNGEVVDATNATYLPTESGSYYVHVSNESGCDVTSASVYILVYPQPTYCVSDVEGCEGDTVNVCINLQANDLIFSQYVEGSGFNKYLELFNGTCLPVDLSLYEIRLYHNGALLSGAPSFTIPLTGMLNAGTAFVIAHPSATAWTGTPDLSTTNFQVNGDDAFVLVRKATNAFVDIFGSLGNDPGSSWRDNNPLSPTFGWSTEDMTLVRKACVYSGITVNPNLAGIGGFPTLTTEWDTLTTDDVSGLGTHSIGTSTDFTIVSGTSVIASESGKCAQIVIGDGETVVGVSAVFCTFNNCPTETDAFVIFDTCGTEAAARSAAAQGSVRQYQSQVYPNPAVDNVTLAFTTQKAGNVNIELVNMYGNVISVIRNQQMEAGVYNINLPIADLAAGTYVVRISTVNGQETLRLVKAGK
ncbi:MAG: T9SS type A sorting domain-containing protein [Flavobacteriales bacterium]